MSAERTMSAIDARHCAFVCWVDLDGMVNMHSEAGYGQRQVAMMLREIADLAESKGIAAGEPEAVCP